MATTRLERIQSTGLRRLGTPAEGFRYEAADGSPVLAGDLERIEGLRIPPAWKDVHISPSPRSSIQAIGKDAAGRWQYLYHASQVKRRERQKFQRLVRFVEALPRMRAAVEKDLAEPAPGKEQVLAVMLRIMSTRFIRPGSPEYAAENGSYGITTLRRRHVKIEGQRVLFDFPGKSGKRQQIEIADEKVSEILKQLLKLPGRHVFQYLDAEGKPVPVRASTLNAYIRDRMQGPFSAKDFRTWAGTLICAGALARRGVDPGEAKRARQRKIVAAVRETAESLRNTPAIARASYISPRVLTSFERGKVIEPCFESVDELADVPRLHRAEKALLELLTGATGGPSLARKRA